MIEIMLIALAAIFLLLAFFYELAARLNMTEDAKRRYGTDVLPTVADHGISENDLTQKGQKFGFIRNLFSLLALICIVLLAATFMW